MMRFTYIRLFLQITLAAMAFPLEAEPPPQKGLAIFRESDRRDQGFGNFTANVVMYLKNRQGQITKRHLLAKTLEGINDGDKNLMIFNSPPDIKGTITLTHTHKLSPDDQWIYLPALKRVKRISANNKSGAFMGSEFSYEDLGSPEVEKYTYEYLRQEAYKKRNCYVVARYPKDPSSGYSKQVVWMDQREYIPLKIDYYDRGNHFLKTLKFGKYRRYLGRHWRAGKLHMINHLTGKETVLIWKDFQFKTPLKENDFNPANLYRINP